MKTLVATLFVLLTAVPSFALVEVGDTMANLSWKNHEGNVVSLDDHKDKVRVMLYNAGWCGPCNTEFSTLVPKVKEFNNQPVVFISLSGAGWNNPSKPDTQFLKEWKNKFKIPFPVCSASVKEQYSFFSDPRIPSVVIVDKKGKLAYKAINPGASAILSKVRQLAK